MNAITQAASIRDRVSDEEWKVRTDLAACYRLVAKYGMSDLIYNHITAKVPDQEGRFLINPFGLLYTEITASCFYTLDLDGNVVDKPEGELRLKLSDFGIEPPSKLGVISMQDEVLVWVSLRARPVGPAQVEAAGG